MTTLLVEEKLEKVYEEVKSEVLGTPAKRIFEQPQIDDAMFALFQGMFNPLYGFRQAIAECRQNFRMVNWGSGPVMILALHFWQKGQEARRS